MLLLLYLGNKNIKIKEKAVYFSLLLFFYASFSVNVLNFIWHGFHYPNSLPCRQSFIYIALVLVMCYKAYLELKNTSWKHIVMAFWGAAAFVILAEKLVDNEEQFHFAVFYAAILFLALYTGCIYLYHSRKWRRDGVLLAVLGLVFCESAVNMAVTSIPTTSRTAYVKDNEDTMLLADSIRSSVFYRIEKGESRTKNDGAWMNFPSASLFSSVASAAMSDFFKSVGCESSTNAYSVKGSTPFIDALFAARRRGVSVRLLVDDFGSRNFLRSNARRDLEAAGVEIASAMPMRLLQLFDLQRADIRLHRKQLSSMEASPIREAST